MTSLQDCRFTHCVRYLLQSRILLPWRQLSTNVSLWSDLPLSSLFTYCLRKRLNETELIGAERIWKPDNFMKHSRLVFLFYFLRTCKADVIAKPRPLWGGIRTPPQTSPLTETVTQIRLEGHKVPLKEQSACLYHTQPFHHVVLCRITHVPFSNDWLAFRQLHCLDLLTVHLL